MMNDQQQQIEIQETQEPSKEGKLVAEIFSEIRKKQFDFLDESGKSIIERIATFLVILFAVTAFSNNFPPAYLKDNLSAKVMVIVTLVLYLLAMGAALLTIQPRFYDVPLYNVTRMSEELKKITTYKMRWLRAAGLLFTLGSIALAMLIISHLMSIAYRSHGTCCDFCEIGYCKIHTTSWLSVSGRKPLLPDALHACFNQASAAHLPGILATGGAAGDDCTNAATRRFLSFPGCYKPYGKKMALVHFP